MQVAFADSEMMAQIANIGELQADRQTEKQTDRQKKERSAHINLFPLT